MLHGLVGVLPAAGAEGCRVLASCQRARAPHRGTPQRQRQLGDDAMQGFPSRRANLGTAVPGNPGVRTSRTLQPFAQLSLPPGGLELVQARPAGTTAEVCARDVDEPNASDPDAPGYRLPRLCSAVAPPGEGSQRAVGRQESNVGRVARAEGHPEMHIATAALKRVPREEDLPQEPDELQGLLLRREPARDQVGPRNRRRDQHLGQLGPPALLGYTGQPGDSGSSHGVEVSLGLVASSALRPQGCTQHLGCLAEAHRVLGGQQGCCARGASPNLDLEVVAVDARDG
mmetsp:Transcript_3408/g.9245  ORF Transcript_3408/g.9245 Transcript_3408/m.9245 type:complete len:286 (-) Transcript_3408:1053-1910(-)